MYGDANLRSLEVFRSGALFYMKEQLFSEQAPELVKLHGSAEEAAAFFASQADDFLTQLGMKRGGFHLKNVSFAELGRVQDGSTNQQTILIGAGVHYGLDLGGIPAWGPGAKTSVYFDAAGITGYYDAMPDFAAVGIADLTSPGEAIASFIKVDKPQTLLRLHSGVVHQAVIEEIKLVYFMEAGNKDQEFILPHYLISGTFHGWNPGPDSKNPREGSTPADPSAFQSLQPAPEPGLLFQLLSGVGGLALLASRQNRRRESDPMREGLRDRKLARGWLRGLFDRMFASGRGENTG